MNGQNDARPSTQTQSRAQTHQATVVAHAARWLVQGADPAMILFSLNEVSIEDASPEADSHIEAIRFTCRKAIATDRRRLNAFRLLVLEQEMARNAADSEGRPSPQPAGEGRN